MPHIRGRSRETVCFIYWKHRARLHPVQSAREFGGASRDRTGDLKLAKLALSQLSYGPAESGSHQSSTLMESQCGGPSRS